MHSKHAYFLAIVLAAYANGFFLFVDSPGTAFLLHTYATICPALALFCVYHTLVEVHGWEASNATRLV